LDQAQPHGRAFRFLGAIPMFRHPSVSRPLLICPALSYSLHTTNKFLRKLFGMNELQRHHFSENLLFSMNYSKSAFQKSV
jgi:hypothetical protein